MAYSCPHCGHTLGKHDTFSAAALAKADPALQQSQQGAAQQQQQQQDAAGASGSGSGGTKWETSAKLEALMQILKKLRDKGAAGVSRGIRLCMEPWHGLVAWWVAEVLACETGVLLLQAAVQLLLCHGLHAATPVLHSAAEAEVQQRRSVLNAGRSVSHARLAAALGGGGSRGPTRGAGSGGAGASRGASPRLPMEKVIVFSQVGAVSGLGWACRTMQVCTLQPATYWPVCTSYVQQAAVLVPSVIFIAPLPWRWPDPSQLLLLCLICCSHAAVDRHAGPG